MEAEQQDSYVLADQDLHRVYWRSSLPPSERPGERRTAEMKKLYGKDAAKIQRMEAAMQLTFDRSCDKKTAHVLACYTTKPVGRSDSIISMPGTTSQDEEPVF
ncbi:gem-associated protein 8-like [Sinocyclocheilus rhinocerous]|uniref:gem-associated protein 8-like n=1 Tax=Sinocyclocheilus rhinocerous TaxID=307959 RepID=UPI0007B93132|nr:PREDICTED: gem-associated protein 8-like [Sinocyclocheilus rhinocerous]